MHDLIASQFLDDYLLLRPGSPSGIKIGPRRHRELEQSANQRCPQWLDDAVRRRWPDLDLASRRNGEVVLVRPVSPYGYGRASYELNLGCNYDCEHCYLGLKRNSTACPGTTARSCCASCATPGCCGCN